MPPSCAPQLFLPRFPLPWSRSPLLMSNTAFNELGSLLRGVRAQAWRAPASVRGAVRGSPAKSAQQGRT